MQETEIAFGSTRTFKDGQTIYEEGARSDGVFLVLDGRVDLWRTKEGAFHFLGSIDKGNLFGEAGVIMDKPRSVTARANGPVQVLFMDSKDFMKSVRDPLVKHVVTAMAERLRERYVPKRELIQESELIAARRQKKKVRKKHTFEPVVEGITPLVIGVMLDKVKVTQLPFAIGNTRVYGEMARLTDQTLMLPLPTASDLDARHFELFRRGPDVLVRDLGSKFGTVVNGQHISKYEKISEIPLEVGENTVGTGGLNSKVTFLITLPEIDG